MYVLVSSVVDVTYVGCTTDVVRRLAEHNGVGAGGAKATRRGRPWHVGVVHGPIASRGEAQRIEACIKKLRGRARLRWVSTGV